MQRHAKTTTLFIVVLFLTFTKTENKSEKIM